MPFPLGINTSTIKTTPLLTKIRLAAEVGFDGVELWVNDLYEYVGLGGEISEIEAVIRDTGLKIPCMIAVRQWGEASPFEYRLVREEARRRFLLASRMGSPFVVATPPYEACDEGQIMERYADLLSLGKEVGIRPTFEYISWFHSIHRLEQAVRVVRELKDEGATLILDAFHTWNSGSSFEIIRQLPVSCIAHYHINDADPTKPAGTQTDPDRVMLGEGPAPLFEELTILKQLGYRGMVSLELFNQDLWKRDPREVLSEGLSRMKALVARVVD